MSSPFDEESADFLEDLGVAVFKIPSGEITNLPFLTHVARKGKPMIVSTGMSYLGEVERAVRVILVEARDISEASTLTEELIAVKRSVTGLPPIMMMPYLIGRRLRVDV